MLAEAAALAEFPACLVELIQARRIEAGHEDSSDAGEATGFDLLTALQGVPEGARQETIFRAACSFRGSNVTKKVALQACLEAARKCSPAFAETEVAKIVARVGRPMRPAASQSCRPRVIGRPSRPLTTIRSTLPSVRGRR
jgi:hypothetical protein